MDLYLVRHGHAVAGYPDPARVLLPHGVAAVERVAARVAAAGLQPARIYHSGYVRAEQTAMILARHLNALDRVTRRQGLGPDDPVAPVAQWLLAPEELNGAGGHMVVGHLPFLARLAAELVPPVEGIRITPFEPATLVKLVPRPDRAGYTIDWVLAPDLA